MGLVCKSTALLKLSNGFNIDGFLAAAEYIDKHSQNQEIE
jgi:3-deoxy-D-arabino-heptulosonate 7-phosphate (DAHP) synthase